MFDARIIVVGVAGIFVALGVAGAFMIGFGHATTALGQVVGSGPIAQGGRAVTDVGTDIIVALIIMAFIVTAVFLYFSGSR